MKNLNRAAWLVMSAALIVVLGTIGLAQPLNEEVRALAVRWLFTDCGLGSSLRDDLRKVASPALESFFLEALHNGPDSGQMTEIEQAAARRYDQRQQALKRPQSLGLTPQDLEEARKVTREDFVAQEKKDFDLRYRSQAVSGLGITGGTKAKAELQKISKDEKSPLRTSAQQALAELRPRK
jgi:HEAT repeat protein